MSRNTVNKNDIYNRITNQIIGDLEKGVKSWTKPWKGGDGQSRITLPLRHSGEQYQGINILSLWASSMDQGFSSATWMTYRQAKEMGGQVLKGEKGSLVVYANTMNRTEENDQGEEIEHQIPYMKGYTVFNVEQIEGLPEKYTVKPEITDNPVERLEHAEKFFTDTGADIRTGGHQAFYTIQHDYVKLPFIEAFHETEGYYATLAHELTHNAAFRIMPRR